MKSGAHACPYGFKHRPVATIFLSNIAVHHIDEYLAKDVVVLFEVPWRQRAAILSPAASATAVSKTRAEVKAILKTSFSPVRLGMTASSNAQRA